MRLLPFLSLSVLLFGCTSNPEATAPPSSAYEAQATTEVVVLGMIHGGHRTSATWGTDELESAIRAISPDVVCTEIPPANWPGVMDLWRADGVVEDSRVSRFPEYVDVLIPLVDELGLVVEPTAGWTLEMARARSASIAAFNSSDEDAAGRALYEADEAWVAAWAAGQPEAPAGDDPLHIHSASYDLATKAELGAYDHHLNEVIGAPGGWTYINEAHFALIDDAIARHPGERILVTFGAGHKYWFLERLRAMEDIELLDARQFLPNAAQRTEREAAGEACLLGLDDLLAWASAARGSSPLVRERITARLGDEALRGRLLGLEGSHTAEYTDAPFIGPVTITERADRGLAVTVGLTWLGEAETHELRVGLLPDADAPDGFVWRQLELPARFFGTQAE